jgi:hypothetical protein
MIGVNVFHILRCIVANGDKMIEVFGAPGECVVVRWNRLPAVRAPNGDPLSRVESAEPLPSGDELRQR